MPALPVHVVCVVQRTCFSHCPGRTAHSFRRESGLAGVSAPVSPKGIQRHHWVWDQVRNRAKDATDPGGLWGPLTASSLSSGKFGAVCTCKEKATGLKLAAKVIKKQTPKDKVVRWGSGICPGWGGDPWSGYLSPPSTGAAEPGACYGSLLQ